MLWQRAGPLRQIKKKRWVVHIPASCTNQAPDVTHAHTQSFCTNDWVVCVCACVCGPPASCMLFFPNLALTRKVTKLQTRHPKLLSWSETSQVQRKTFKVCKSDDYVNNKTLPLILFQCLSAKRQPGWLSFTSFRLHAHTKENKLACKAVVKAKLSQRGFVQWLTGIYFM